MAHTFPVPIFTTSVQLNGVTKEKLNATSPGTTDDLLTKGPSVTIAAAKAYYLSPEATAVVGTINAVGTASGIGWGLVPSDPSTLVPLATDGLTLSSGTFTVQVVAARDTGGTSADQTVTFTAILFLANSNATTFSQELGRQSSTSVTVTTTKTAFPITIATAAATFAPGQILWLEIFATTTTTSVTGSIASYYTNSSTSIRLSATTSTYSINFNKNISDSAAISDSVNRIFNSYRSLSEISVVGDTITTTTSHPRSLSETLSTVSDNVLRNFISNRVMSDLVNVSESIMRKFISSRTINDSAVVSDGVVIRKIYNRSLLDTLNTGGGAVYNLSPIFIIED